MTADRLIGEHADERQVAIPFVVIQAVAHNKFVRDVEAYVVRVDQTGAVDFLSKQNADFEAQRAAVCGEVSANGVQGDAAVEDVVKNQDMATAHVGDKADAAGVAFCGGVVKRRVQVMAPFVKGRAAMERSRLMRLT